jgi:undecaprenyl diphosphate synthase
MAPEASHSSASPPRHIAVIMDGNGRWARAKGRPRHAGHRAGVKAARNIVRTAAERGIEVLTLFAFSSENWKRPAEEVSSLMGLFLEVLQREVDELDRNGVQIKFIGAREELSGRLQKRLAKSEKQTAGNTKLKLYLAVAYGGRWDIVQSVRSVAEDVRSNKLEPGDINEESITSRMSLAAVGPPDLLIRTGGEHRVSNFLLWDMAYSELYFTDTLWPEFGEDDLDKAIAFFTDRERRFGQTSGQVGANGRQETSE